MAKRTKGDNDNAPGTMQPKDDTDSDESTSRSIGRVFSTDGSGLYRPSPNPPSEPKPCQDCEDLVDGTETSGWWLEREHWQDPNTYELFCVSCCIEKMRSWPNYPDVDTEQDVEETLLS